MNDTHDRRAPNRLRAQLEAARTAGSWMPWAGASMAVLLWGGVGAFLFASIGPAVILAQPPLVLVGGIAALLATGILSICAGVMARESTRSAHANAVVLSAARNLLEPAETARTEISSIAEAVTRETHNLNRALSETRSRFDDIKREIETSVTGAMKAAEIVRTDSEVLIHKMSSERLSMTQLAESLRNQSESLAKSIPRHAQMMSDAARLAQEQVRDSESMLDKRLRDLEDTAGNLAQRIDQLDSMGAESRKRAQNLATVLMRLDEQLVQSTRMVESATKAGELAAAATKSTGESLRDAVSDALSSALKATETINSRSAQAAEDAREAMVRLKEAGLQAEATTRAASLAAKSQADQTEQRINQLSEFLFRAATKATNAAEGGLERARQRIEKASLLLGQIQVHTKDEPVSSSIDDMILEPPPQPAHVTPAPRNDDLVLDRRTAQPVHDTHRPPAENDDFVLDRRAPSMAPETLRPAAGKPTATSEFQSAMRDAGASDELILQHVASIRRPGQPQSAQQRPYDPFFDGPKQAGGASPVSWRDLLTGIEEMPVERREATAGHMVDRLDRAGVYLGVVKASDLRRIATAAHHGERQRRRAIRDIAPGEIQRVSRLLEADRDLQHAARNFLNSEEPEALRELATAERAREDAHPRLSAYLLLDAALGAAI